MATGGNEKFDKDGEIARRGRVNVTLLGEMQQLDFFAKNPPKTTGRELFSFQLAEKWRLRGNQICVKENGIEMSAEDFIATVTELTAWSIADSYKRWSPGPLDEVIVSGGGCRNKFLMERLTQFLPGITVKDHEAIGINSDAKEALLFALLAWLCINGQHGNVPSCTGAKEEVILGKISPGKNFSKLLKRAES